VRNWPTPRSISWLRASEEDSGFKSAIRAEQAWRARQSSAAPSVDSGEQLIDDLGCNALVVKVRAGDIPPSHGTVESDEPRDTVPPKIPRPKVARVVHGPRVVCSSAVRS
jgi:hypothetical protein